MAEKKKNTAEAVRELLEEKINSLGYEVWDVEYVKEGGDYHLIITIDKDEGVFIEDCEKVHRFIDPLLDEADPIEDSYILQVSSPGIERELRTEEHYLACIGEIIEIKLFTAIEGKKKLLGELVSFDRENGIITVNENGKNISLPKSAVSRCNIHYDFE